MRIAIIVAVVAVGGCTPKPIEQQPERRTIRLVSSTFELQPGAEGYQCQVLTLTEDVFVKRITPVAPLGVHHITVGIDTSGAPDGVTRCGPLAPNAFFALGVNSDAVSFPDPAVVKLSAGQKIVLNLHLFNASTSVRSGEAAIDVEAITAPSRYEIASIALIGPPGFVIGPSRTVDARCTVQKRATWFALFPHMHQTGQHMKAWRRTPAGGETVIWDEDFTFEEQTIGVFAEPIVLDPGDRIDATCTYTEEGVGKTFGDSSNAEMCFAIAFTYPPIASTFCNN
jgi:hypothetical protein